MAQSWVRSVLLGFCFAASSASAWCDIVVGQSIALTGGLAEFGQAVVRGAKLHLDQVNAAGGINGQKVVVKTLDDNGKADKAAENVRALIERDKVLAIFGGIEGGPCTRTLKVAVELKTPFIACLAGSPEMREPFAEESFTVRAPHFAEFEKIIEIAASYGMTRFGFLHADSDTGRKHLANVNRLLAARKLPSAKSFVMVSGAKPDAIAGDVLASDVQAVFNHGSYDFYSDVILQVRGTSPTKPSFFAVNSGIAQMARKLGERGKGLTFTSVVPFPNSGREEVAREFRKLYTASYGRQSASLAEMEGYISAKVLTEGLRRAGRRPTRESLVNAMTNLGTYDAGGYLVRYVPEDHVGSRYVNTAVIRGDGRFVY